MEQDSTEHNSGLGKDLPPLPAHVEIYFLQKGLSNSDALRFFDHFERLGWKDTYGKPLRNWKTLACDWIWEMRYFRAKR